MEEQKSVHINISKWEAVFQDHSRFQFNSTNETKPARRISLYNVYIVDILPIRREREREEEHIIKQM